MSNRKRRVVLLESMFRQVCTKEELSKVTELYENGFKGSAINYMTRKVKVVFDDMIEKKNNPVPAFDSGTKSLLKPLQF